MPVITATRGRVYMADLGYGDKPWLVVSNNARNAHLLSVLAVRITTTPRVTERVTVVELGPADPLVGRVLCDDLEQLDRDELRRDVGALSLPTMVKVAEGLRAALAL